MGAVFDPNNIGSGSREAVFKVRGAPPWGKRQRFPGEVFRMI